jgi:hypothetical protein
MSAWQIGRPDRDRPDLVHLATVDANPLLYDEPADLGGGDLLEGLANGDLLRLVAPERGEDLVEHVVDRVRARVLLMGAQRRGDLRLRQLLHTGPQCWVLAGLGIERPARLRGAADEILLQPRQLLAFGVAERDRLEHGLFRDFFGAGLDHEHGVLGSGDDELECRDLLLLRGRVDDAVAVHLPDAHGADGPVERHA